MNSEPLKNRTIFTTRTPNTADKLTEPLRKYGATVYNLPTIEIQPAVFSSEIEHVLNNIHNFDWLLFTSQNGVRYFLELYKKVHLSGQLPSGLQIGVYGQKSASCLRENGINPDYVSKAKTSDNFFRHLQEKLFRKNQHVLLAMGNLASYKHEKYFEGFVNCSRLIVYHNTIPRHIDRELLSKITADNYDMIVFTSPSTFNNLVYLTQNEISPEKIRAASIGTTTKKAIESQGGNLLLTARKPNIQTLIEDIVQYFHAGDQLIVE